MKTSSLRILSFCLSLMPAAFFLAPNAALAANNNYLSYKGETAAPQCTKILNDGLYIGVGAGFDSYRDHSNINASFNGDTFTANPIINATGFMGGIFGGYGMYFTRILYLAGEAFLNTSSASASSNYNDIDAGTTYTSRLSTGTTFGLGLLPGLKVNDSSLLYIRLGASFANVENHENFATAGLSTGSDTKTWLRGFTYGLGIETVVYKDFSLRTEFTHTDYNYSSYSPLGTYFSPADNQFVLGLIYHVNN